MLVECRGLRGVLALGLRVRPDGALHAFLPRTGEPNAGGAPMRLPAIPGVVTIGERGPAQPALVPCLAHHAPLEGVSSA